MPKVHLMILSKIILYLNKMEINKKGGAGIIIAVIIIVGLIVSGVVLYFVFSGEKSSEGTIFHDKPTGLIITSKGELVPGEYLFVKYTSPSGLPIKMSNNEINLGNKVQIEISDIEGWIFENERAFLAASMKVVSSKGEVILDESNLFSDYETSGVSIEDSKIVAPKFTIGTPMISGETYTWTSKIWDLRGEGEINTEVELKVIE